MAGYAAIMSDVKPENFSEFATQDGPGSAGNDPASGERAHPEQEAHGGSMAPGLVDDAGHPVAEPPPGTPERD